MLSTNSAEGMVCLDDILALWTTPGVGLVKLGNHVRSLLDSIDVRSHYSASIRWLVFHE